MHKKKHENLVKQKRQRAILLTKLLSEWWLFLALLKNGL